MPAGCFLLAESTEKPGEAYNVEAKVCPLQAKVWGGGGAGTQRTAHSTKHACSWVGPSIVRLGWLRRDSPLACNAQKGRACTVKVSLLPPFCQRWQLHGCMARTAAQGSL